MTGSSHAAQRSLGTPGPGSTATEGHPSTGAVRPFPRVGSSPLLRLLIEAKRKRGEVAEALVLARLGVRIATREPGVLPSNELSRRALIRYLELMPEDAEVREALATLGEPSLPLPPRLAVRRGFLWALSTALALGLPAAVYLHSPTAAPTIIPPAQAVAIPPPAPIPATAEVVPAASLPVRDPTPIVIRSVGDVVLGSDYPQRRLPGEKARARMISLHAELSGADIVVGNLEGVLADRGKARKDPGKKGMYTFRMPKEHAAILREMGFDVLSLANNHSLDFGREGLESTLDALRTAGIQPVGVPGAEIAAVKVRDTTIAFLNYSYLPAFARIDEEERIKAEIAAALVQADLVIVTVHGGKEGIAAAGRPTGDEYFMNEYRGNMVRFSQLAIDAGASAIFGHGPHVVRPYEVYKDKPIFFSLGNFIGYRSLSTKGKLASSVVAEVRFSPEGEFLGAGVIPLRLDYEGIPQVDYSARNLDVLDGLLDETLDKRPVLNLAAPPRVAPDPVPTPALAEAMPIAAGDKPGP